MSYLIMVVASQQDKQRQGQGDVRALGDVLLRQFPLQTPRAPSLTCHPLSPSRDHQPSGSATPRHPVSPTIQLSLSEETEPTLR